MRFNKEADVAVAPINRMDQVFQDPQMVHMHQVVTVAHPTDGDIKVVGPAVSYSLTSSLVTTPPLLLGEHTREEGRSFSREPNPLIAMDRVC